jgi:NAD(P)H-quinone oxidoreductase subunit 5
MSHASLISVLGLVVIFPPMALVIVLGISSLLDRPLNESATSRLCQATIVAGLVAALGILSLMLLHGTRHESIELGEWVAIPHYHFSVKLIFDRLSVPFAILTFMLCGIIAAFAARYMHREQGYNRFFVLFSLFVLGMVVASLAGTIETLFVGWELVGLSSALLVAYFQERPAPVRNGLRVWIVYRISDAALLLAAIAMHHLVGEGDFDKLVSAGEWPMEVTALSGTHAFIVGLLLVIAAAGKSALLPFSGWLPRAMEGPTPSSAVFYGALSVHLGAFLLLRASPLLDATAGVSAIVVILGLATSVYAFLAGSVQSDIKSALAFASLAQVGLIVGEIGLGFRYFALVHLLGNACLRTLQFLRAPTLLHDYHLLENAIGGPLPLSNGQLPGAPLRLRNWLYRFALERGYLDSLLTTYVVAPFVQLFRNCDALERRWTDFLTGSASRASDQTRYYSGAIEELP